MLLFLVLLLILAAGLGIFRAMLRGTLSLMQFDGSAEPVPLPPRPWLLLPAGTLIGTSGRILIAGIPFTRRMHIWIRCPGRPHGDGTLQQGGRRYISGIWVTHDASQRQDDLPSGIDLGPTGL